ncbi:hypothetical protein Aduo_010066 [Ancylostoma duodenale]
MPDTTAEGRRGRNKSANFSDEENRRLVRWLVDNFEEYQGLTGGGSRTERGSVKENFHRAWAERISALGHSMRTPMQIAEKIRKNLTKCRNYISALRRNQTATGGGPPTPLPHLPAYLDPLVAGLRGEESIVGYEGGREYYGGSGELPVNRAEEPVVLEEAEHHEVDEIAAEQLGDAVDENENIPVGEPSGIRRMTLPTLRKKYLLKELQVAEVQLEKEKKLLELAAIMLERQKNK